VESESSDSLELIFQMINRNTEMLNQHSEMLAENQKMLAENQKVLAVLAQSLSEVKSSQEQKLLEVYSRLDVIEKSSTPSLEADSKVNFASKDSEIFPSSTDASNQAQATPLVSTEFTLDLTSKLTTQHKTKISQEVVSDQPFNCVSIQTMLEKLDPTFVSEGVSLNLVTLLDSLKPFRVPSYTLKLSYER